MRRRRTLLPALAVAAALVLPPAAAPAGPSGVRTADLREWLGYIASDALQGRATFAPGLGLAAAYIERHLLDWGVTPAGDAGSYRQTVRVHGVKVRGRSSVTVRLGSETRTFKDGDDVTFPRNVGGARVFTVDRVEFTGYGLDAPGADHLDFRGKDVRGAAVVWLGAGGPRRLDAQTYRRVLSGRGRYATEQMQAAAAIGPRAASPPASGERGRTAPHADAAAADLDVDFTTVQRLDMPLPPAITAGEAFFAFLFSRAPASYGRLKRLAHAREPLPSFRLDGVSLTFDLAADYEIVRTQQTQNVVAVIEGSDSQLKHGYVALGAHYDHVGAEDATGQNRRTRAPGRVNAAGDRIWNGADDDGSGTVALMALAKAFAGSPRPRRSMLLVWHAGEERGLLGSRYFVDQPTVPLEAIVAQLNMDMIGRNRDDRPGEANTVYVVGSDRISSELHEINREANRALADPLTLDYTMNDPAEIEQIYFRSDHYSYAARGIPVIFFTTGLHGDYHANTDEVGKIEFEKLTRIVELVYQTGRRLADREHAPVRDNKGPRAGRGTTQPPVDGS